MKLIAKKCFPQAVQVTDRFHVQKLAIAALQDIRIKHQWETKDHENKQLQKARIKGIAHDPKMFPNGNIKKQLLARSRYLLHKVTSNWTGKQKGRTKILFGSFPDKHKAYTLVINLRNMFNQTRDIAVAYTKLAHWYKEVGESGYKPLIQKQTASV